jgi:hypothetical protein
MYYILFIIFTINTVHVLNICLAGRGGTKKKKGLNVMHTEALYANEVEQHDDENRNTSGTNVVRSISFIWTSS